jgi:hypothetical protein
VFQARAKCGRSGLCWRRPAQHWAGAQQAGSGMGLSFEGLSLKHYMPKPNVIGGFQFYGVLLQLPSE